jgi:hypothetical protein
MQSMDGIDVASLQEVWAPELVARASDGPPPSTVRRRPKSALAEDG